MAKLAVVAVSVLLASCFATGQAQAPSATVQAGPPIANAPSQTDNGTGEIPTFRSHARQVLVTAWVWKHAARNGAWVPKEILRRYPFMVMPPVARGLSAKDSISLTMARSKRSITWKNPISSCGTSMSSGLFTLISGELGARFFQMMCSLQHLLRHMSSDILRRCCSRATVIRFG